MSARSRVMAWRGVWGNMACICWACMEDWSSGMGGMRGGVCVWEGGGVSSQKTHPSMKLSCIVAIHFIILV